MFHILAAVVVWWILMELALPFWDGFFNPANRPMDPAELEERVSAAEIATMTFCLAQKLDFPDFAEWRQLVKLHPTDPPRGLFDRYLGCPEMEQQLMKYFQHLVQPRGV